MVMVFDCSEKVTSENAFVPPLCRLIVDIFSPSIFFQVAKDGPLCYSDCIFQIARLVLQEEKVVPTGYSIPLTASLVFSPDDALVYAGGQINSSTWDIYVFDPDTGALRAGGQIYGPESGFAMIPAVRW
jgi:hypothetical protein